MASIVRSHPLHKFPFSDLKWSINLTTTTRLGSQSADSTGESPLGDSGVKQLVESEFDDRRVWTHCSSLQVSRNGVEDPTVVIDPAALEKTAAPSEGSNISIRLRSKLEKSRVVAEEEAEKQPPPPPQAQARSVVAASEQDESSSRVWNLRPRKPSHKKSAANSAVGVFFGVPHDDSTDTLRKCTDVSGEVKEEKKKKKKKKAKFSIALSKLEIEADFKLFTGGKPPRRPKKRPRTVQKKIDYIFPGLSLPFAVTAQMYEVSLPAP